MVLDQPFPPDIRVENEACSLIGAGHEVTLLSLSPDERPGEEIYRGIRVIREKIPAQLRNKLRGLAGSLPLLTWYLAWLLTRFHRRNRVDVIHVHDLYLFGGGIRAAKRIGVPVVGDLHENWVEALKHYAWSTRVPGKWVVNIPRWEKMERLWVNAVNRLVVVVQEAEQRNLDLGVPAKKITVVPNTIKLSTFDSFAVDESCMDRVKSELTITYTGGFDVHRGLASVIEAMPSILERYPGARLVLVGEGSIRPELEVLASRLGVGASVQFEGWKRQEKLKSYIMGSDVCLVPHLKTIHTDATIPHKIFHYMYYEKPVVVSNCRPLERIVMESNGGLVYPAGDAVALAGAVLRLAGDRDLAKSMGERGKQAVMEKYNWEASVGGLIELYRGLGALQTMAGH